MGNRVREANLVGYREGSAEGRRGAGPPAPQQMPGARPTLKVVGGPVGEGVARLPAPLRIKVDPRGRTQEFVILVSALTPEQWATVPADEGRWLYRWHEPIGRYMRRIEVLADGTEYAD